MLRKLILILFAFSFAPLQGCGVTDSQDDPINRELPRPLSAQEMIISDASNHFAFNLLHKLGGQGVAESFFFSPLSIHVAFGMALNGTDAETYNEMSSFFGLDGLTNEEINQAYRDLIGLLLSLDKKVIMKIANSVWYREGFEVLAPFLDANREYFNAMVKELDFSDPASADIINGWIEENTGGLIKEMIEQIDASVVMFIINAIYFKGDWTVQFDPADTKPKPFFRGPDESVQVQMMNNKDHFRYFSDGTWTAVDMWFGTSAFSFTALIPNEGFLTGELIESLTVEQFDSITNSLGTAIVDLAFPKFEIDYEIEGFPAMLKEMGLVNPFMAGEADFSRINPDEELFISDVMHRAVIKLDEEGAEAAAATVIVISRTSMPLEVNVRFDRPFLFFIRENTSNTILFMGVYQGE